MRSELARDRGGPGLQTIISWRQGLNAPGMLLYKRAKWRHIANTTGDHMPDSSQLVIGADLSGQPIAQAMRLANRHGLVAGATRP